MVFSHIFIVKNLFLKATLDVSSAMCDVNIY